MFINNSQRCEPYFTSVAHSRKGGRTKGEIRNSVDYRSALHQKLCFSSQPFHRPCALSLCCSPRPSGRGTAQSNQKDFTLVDYDLFKFSTINVDYQNN